MESTSNALATHPCGLAGYCHEMTTEDFAGNAGMTTGTTAAWNMDAPLGDSTTGCIGMIETASNGRMGRINKRGFDRQMLRQSFRPQNLCS